MPDIVGIRFKKAGKVYYFDPAGTELKMNDWVVVQTARGVEIGQVMITPRQVLAAEVTAELKTITRKANPEDVKRSQDYADKEAGAMLECSKIVAKLKLDMKLVSAEYNLDGSRLTFYFTAEERVDFRELVRELTAYFKTRIELRQIGPRDQAKIVGGLGRCGRPLCCDSFLTEFSPVSIKMAKEQDLPLDPMKISGVCGRLQCCLAYESAQYREAKALMPKKGLAVETPAGKGFISGVFPLKETVMVDLETQTSAEFPVSQIKIIENFHPQAPPVPVAEDESEAAEKARDGVAASSPVANPAPAPQTRQPLPPKVASPVAVDTAPAAPLANPPIKAAEVDLPAVEVPKVEPATPPVATPPAATLPVTAPPVASPPVILPPVVSPPVVMPPPPPESPVKAEEPPPVAEK
jgi:cell fate regulator YaaT (PSP1 superfamily)